MWQILSGVQERTFYSSEKISLATLMKNTFTQLKIMYKCRRSKVISIYHLLAVGS